mmetsp:Transcript_46463/g.137282  ORF Transcript_46463/g.137282 Transcript_46463/m.137282 type:complete len:157 (+) Transcript_46463:453-923(+)
MGHQSRDCPNRKQDSFSSFSSNKECYNCGQTGHMSRDCPEPRQGGFGGGGGFGRLLAERLLVQHKHGLLLPRLRVRAVVGAAVVGAAVVRVVTARHPQPAAPLRPHGLPLRRVPLVEAGRPRGGRRLLVHRVGNSTIVGSASPFARSVFLKPRAAR